MWLLALAMITAPWGKDAELVSPSIQQEKTQSGLIAKAGVQAIRFHQVVISPVDGPRSHFYPCSSQYTLVAMQKYGFFKGFVMGCDRLMRENNDPWIYRTRVVDEGKIKEDLP